jgi:molybdenum cofactor sulfurtransferase
VSKALEYEEWEWNRMFSSGHACGANEMAIINRRPTGIVRASLGAMTTKADVQALLLFLHNEFIAEATQQIDMGSLLEPSRETLRLPLREMKANYSITNGVCLKEP